MCCVDVRPGSHDAMSYCLDMKSPMVQSQPVFIRLLDRLFRCLTRPVILRWATTQVRRVDNEMNKPINKWWVYFLGVYKVTPSFFFVMSCARLLL